MHALILFSIKMSATDTKSLIVDCVQYQLRKKSYEAELKDKYIAKSNRWYSVKSFHIRPRSATAVVRHVHWQHNMTRAQIN